MLRLRSLSPTSSEDTPPKRLKKSTLGDSSAGDSDDSSTMMTMSTGQGSTPEVRGLANRTSGPSSSMIQPAHTALPSKDQQEGLDNQSGQPTTDPTSGSKLKAFGSKAAPVIVNLNRGSSVDGISQTQEGGLVGNRGASSDDNDDGNDGDGVYDDDSDGDVDDSVIESPRRRDLGLGLDCSTHIIGEGGDHTSGGLAIEGHEEDENHGEDDDNDKAIPKTHIQIKNDMQDEDDHKNDGDDVEEEDESEEDDEDTLEIKTQLKITAGLMHKLRRTLDEKSRELLDAHEKRDRALQSLTDAVELQETQMEILSTRAEEVSDDAWALRSFGSEHNELLDRVEKMKAQLQSELDRLDEY
ncbi:hypothetical protein BGZ83_009930 [Gryganskiella cystojenkinii]|nr:hypothetical protein BGZ83_009930 [Gryganskiella cystojenkinii]